MDIALHKPTVGADYLEFNMISFNILAKISCN